MTIVLIGVVMLVVGVLWMNGDDEEVGPDLSVYAPMLLFGALIFVVTGACTMIGD